jgi:hypothetical protein
MSAVSSLADGIKQMISNKYINKQNTMIADNIQNQIDEQKSNELVNLISAPPSEDIYPAQLNETVGAFVDKYVMSPMMQKEQAGMGLTPTDTPLDTSILPQVPQQATQQQSTPNAVSGETMLPKSNVQQLYNIIKEMPTNEISWDGIYNKMTEKKPYFMGETESEKFVINQMMAQSKDPRDKLESDINLAKLVDEALYPKPDKATSDFERYQQDPEAYKAFKEAGRTPKAPTEFDKKLEILRTLGASPDEFKKLLGTFIAPDKQSDFEKKWDILMARDHTIAEEDKLLGTYIAPKSGDTPKAPTYNTAEKIDEGFRKTVENMDDFVSEIKRLQSLNIDTKAYETTEYYAKLMKEKFEKQMSFVDYASSKIEAGIESDEEYNYRQKYKDAWANARRYEEEYFKVTSEKLLVPGWENK